MLTVSPASLSSGEGLEPPDFEFACPLCCGEVPPSNIVTLSSCGHQGGNPCVSTWIERHEQSGRTSPPTCPFCRTPLSDGDVVQVLGRSFVPRDALLKPPPEEEIDELTLAWLDNNTVTCPGVAFKRTRRRGATTSRASAAANSATTVARPLASADIGIARLMPTITSTPLPCAIEMASSTTGRRCAGEKCASSAIDAEPRWRESNCFDGGCSAVMKNQVAILTHTLARVAGSFPIRQSARA